MLRHLAVLCLAAGGVAGCTVTDAVAQPDLAVPKDWVNIDVGPFSFKAPATLASSGGRALDSQAGKLSSDALTLSYDFGLYSDPLLARDVTRDYRSRTGLLDGLDARYVSFTLVPAQQGTPNMQHCEGVHVPQVSQSAMGPLRLTLLACSAKPGGLSAVQNLFATVRLRADARR